MTDVKTPFGLRLMGPVEVYADAMVTQVTHDTSLQVRCHTSNPPSLSQNIIFFENWLKVSLRKMTYLGLRNSDAVESENI